MGDNPTDAVGDAGGAAAATAATTAAAAAAAAAAIAASFLTDAVALHADFTANVARLDRLINAARRILQPQLPAMHARANDTAAKMRPRARTDSAAATVVAATAVASTNASIPVAPTINAAVAATTTTTTAAVTKSARDHYVSAPFGYIDIDELDENTSSGNVAPATPNGAATHTAEGTVNVAPALAGAEDVGDAAMQDEQANTDEDDDDDEDEDEVVEEVEIVSVAPEDRYTFHDSLVNVVRRGTTIRRGVGTVKKSVASMESSRTTRMSLHRSQANLPTYRQLSAQPPPPTPTPPPPAPSAQQALPPQQVYLASPKTEVHKRISPLAPGEAVHRKRENSVKSAKKKDDILQKSRVHIASNESIGRHSFSLGDDSDTHLGLGLKWSSKDYIAAAAAALDSPKMKKSPFPGMSPFMEGNKVDLFRSKTRNDAFPASRVAALQLPMDGRRSSDSSAIRLSRHSLSIPEHNVLNTSRHVVNAKRAQASAFSIGVQMSPDPRSYQSSRWVVAIDDRVKEDSRPPSLASARNSHASPGQKDVKSFDNKSFESGPSWADWLCWHFLGAAFDEKGTFVAWGCGNAEPLGVNKFWSHGFHERSVVFVFYDLGMIAVYIFVLLILPFEEAYFDSPESMDTLLFGLSAIFAADTVVNFFKPKLKWVVSKSIAAEGTTSMLKLWQIEYAKKYLLIDIISIIPWTPIIPDLETSIICSTFRLLRTYRCTSLMAHNPLVRRMYQQIANVPDIGNLLSRIIPVAGYFILFLHVQACLLFYCGKVLGFPTWDLQYTHWAVYPGGVNAAGVKERYVWMLTQALGNTFQFAYKPETVVEQILTIVFVILGGLMYAYLVGLVSSAAISFDASGRLYRQKIDELTEYVHWKNINEHTKKRLLQYYEFKYRGKYFEERALLNDMNSSLRMELATLNCSSLIEKVPFLKRTAHDGRDTVYIGRIATALNPVYFIPGDYIVTQGEQATEMFFIQMGRVDIIVNGAAVTSFKEGEFFGEVALIANIPRTATVQAATFCLLYSLSAKDFNAIILEFGDIKQRIDAIYEERMAKVRMEQAAAIKKSASILDNHHQK